MSKAPQLPLALAHIALGRDLFPFELARKGGKLAKTPLARWTREATTDEETIRAWAEEHPTCLWGWRLPAGLLVADVDDEEAFAGTGLELPEAPMQRTPSGGRHLLYTGDGRQAVKEVAGLDTRVGGKGWVGLYAEDAFSGEAPEAPPWLLMPRAAGPAPSTDADLEPMETRGELIAFAGAMRAGGMTGPEVYAILEHRLEQGGIRNKDEGWPWTRADLRKIAQEASRWARGEPMEPPVVKLNGQGAKARRPAPGNGRDANRAAEVVELTARELDSREYPETRWVIPGLLPEGTTLLVARPKIGKSFLAFQTAIAASLGSTVLGQRSGRGSALYLALEDGEKRGQKRMRALRAEMGLRAFPEDLTLVFDAPRLGSGLEEYLNGWLDRHPDALMVWIDTLAKIRPVSSGRRNMYEVDYEDMTTLQALVKDRGVALGLVHHDRKAEAEDYLDSVSGTHGITGSADTILVLRRARGEAQAVLHVTGRDIEEERSVALVKKGIIWELSDAPLPTKGAKQNLIMEFLFGNGRSKPSEVHEGLGLDGTLSSTQKMMGAMADEGLIEGNGYKGYAPVLPPPNVTLNPYKRTSTSSASNKEEDSASTSKDGEVEDVEEEAHARAAAGREGAPRRRIIK